MNEPTKLTTLRQRAFRERKAALELAEVRGIFAPAPLHAKIKAAAAKIVNPKEDSHEKDPL